MKGRRQPKSEQTAIRPPSTDTRRYASRDSDASLCSSRPSSIGTGRASTISAATISATDRAAALRNINSYLSPNLHLRPPLPPAKDVLDSFRFLLSRLRWPIGSDAGPNSNLNVFDDIPILLSHMGCPFKLSKSALKAPSTPHSWPSILTVLLWMVQLARYYDHLASSKPSPSFYSPSNHLLIYIIQSYSHFIRGDDDSAASIDTEYAGKIEQQSSTTESSVATLRKEADELESQLQAMRAGPSPRELLEKEKGDLLEDVRKFHAVIENFEGKLAALEKGLEEREKQLETKVTETRRMCEENEELMRQIESQAVNVRDADRMKRELQAVERDVAEAEVERNAWEEKMWELETNAGQKVKELEGLISECNQAMKRLKLGNDSQFLINAEGSSLVNVLGIDYKTTLKPALTALADETKKSSVVKLEESISLQQQLRENATKFEAKRTHHAALQSRMEENEARSSMLKKEIQDQVARCAAETERLHEDVERKRLNLDLAEREAEEYLKNRELSLQDVVRQNDEKTQTCACELLAVIDSVSKYKEHMESTISGMKATLSDTAGAIAETHKASLSAKLGTSAIHSSA